jgi:hypothetical protein
MVITDTFIEIGSSHKICQDYILKDDKTNSIILSDGCSSSKYTDIGSRILSHLALKKLRRVFEDNNFPFDNIKYGLSIADSAHSITRDLDLPDESMDATLIVSYYDKVTNSIFINFYGDGYVVTLNKDDFMEIIYIKYDREMPFYLSYEAVALFRNLEKYKSFKINQQICKMVEDEVSLIEYKPGISRHTIRLPLDYMKCVLLASDGLGSFVKKIDPADIQSICKMFLHYPVKNGEFLKRTMIFQLKKLEKEGIHHYDDLSIGAYLVKE